jgi:hypothetical protein
MKQHLVLTHQQSLTVGRKEIDKSSKDQHFGMLCFYENVRTSNFFVDTKFWQKACL